MRTVVVSTKIDPARLVQRAEELAEQYKWGNGPITDKDRMWGLFCHSVRVAQLWPSPPRSGYPARSTMPDAPDDVTYFQKVRLALEQGESLSEIGDKPTFTPDAFDQSLAEFIIEGSHSDCLKVADGKRLRAALTSLAAGVKPQKVMRYTGLNQPKIKRAKDQLCGDLEKLVTSLTNNTEYSRGYDNNRQNFANPSTAVLAPRDPLK